MIFESDYKLLINDINTHGSLRNKAFLGILEDIASMHSGKVGLGLYDIPKTNLSWVLLDWKLQVISRPKYGETLRAKTWSRYIYKCYAYRDFELYDLNQNLIAIATSKWVLIDASKNKIIKVEDNIKELYKSEEKSVFDIVELDKLKEPKNFESFIEYKVSREDIDGYNHVHNLNYLSYAYEALPEEVYKQEEFLNVRITYKKEIKLNSNIKCMYVKNNNKHVVVIKDKEEKVLHAIIELW